MLKNPHRLLRPLALSISLFAALFSSPSRADMNINVGKLSADGLEVRSLSCSLKDGGLFGAITVVGALSKQRKAIDACAPAGAAFSVEFSWKDGKTSDAKVTASSGDKKADECIVAALNKVKGTVTGTCTTVLLAGNKAKAEAAAGTLKKAAAAK